MLWRLGYRHVVDADIKGFFDNIPHHVIMAAVAAEIADGNILRIVEAFLKAGVVEDGVLKPTPIGHELELRAHPVEVKGRKVRVAVSVWASGTETARGEVVAVQMPDAWVEEVLSDQTA